MVATAPIHVRIAWPMRASEAALHTTCSAALADFTDFTVLAASISGAISQGASVTRRAPSLVAAAASAHTRNAARCRRCRRAHAITQTPTNAAPSPATPTPTHCVGGRSEERAALWVGSACDAYMPRGAKRTPRNVSAPAPVRPVASAAHCRAEAEVWAALSLSACTHHSAVPKAWRTLEPGGTRRPASAEAESDERAHAGTARRSVPSSAKSSANGRGAPTAAAAPVATLSPLL